MNQITFNLVLKSKKFKIPTKFNHLGDVSTKVYNSLIFSPEHEYLIQSNVSEEVLKSFIKYWTTEEIPDILVDNYFEYSELSQEFNILKEYVQKKKKEFGSSLNLFQNLKNPDQKKRLQQEENTASKLQNYLDEYGIEMMKLPINTLFNIFKHPKRNLNNHDLAYSLISAEYQISKDANIFILISTLDGSKLSQKNLKDSIFNKDFHCGFVPEIQKADYLRVVESEKQIEQKISNLQEIVDGQKDEISKLEKSIDLTKKKERKKMYDFLTTLKSNSDQIDSISEIDRQEVEAITDSQNKEISSLKESLSMKSREIDQMEKNEIKNYNKFYEIILIFNYAKWEYSVIMSYY